MYYVQFQNTSGSKVLIKNHRPLWASPIAQLVKNLPAMQETPIQFLGWEDSLEKGEATHCSTLGLPSGSDSKESPATWEIWV